MPEEGQNGQDHTPGAKPLWLFLHIPKTAGSSFGTSLVKQLHPNHNINIDGVRGTKPRNAAFADAIDKFITLDKQQPFAFVTGHLLMPEVVRIREVVGRPVRVITMLREPISRVISDYRYQRTPAHTTHEQFRAQYPTIESFVDDRRSQNKMFRFLSLKGEPPEATIARLEADFAFVGVVERYAQSVRACSKLIGVDLADDTRVRVNPRKKDDVEITDALTDKIRRLNWMDEQVWRHFHDRVQQLPDDRIDGDRDGHHEQATEAAPRSDRLAAVREGLRKSFAMLSGSRN
jgi:hypothetical protein